MFDGVMLISWVIPSSWLGRDVEAAEYGLAWFKNRAPQEVRQAYR